MNVIFTANRLVIVLGLIMFYSKCSNHNGIGITAEEVSNNYNYQELMERDYANDSIKQRILQVDREFQIFNSIPIKKPDIKYSLRTKNDTITHFYTYLADVRIKYNQAAQGQPKIQMRIDSNQNGTYNLTYEHIYKEKILEQIEYKNQSISHTKFGNGKTEYLLYNRKGEYREVGLVKDSLNQEDTTYIDDELLLKSILYDSINIKPHKK